MAVPRTSNPAVVALDNDIYVLSGNTASVERYNAQTATWVAAPPMLTTRWGTTAATLNGRVYVIGGGPSFGNRVETFDGTTWRTGPSLNHYRTYACAVSVASGNEGLAEIFVLGGYWRWVRDSVESLAAGASSWDVSTTPALGQTRSYPTCAGETNCFLFR